jgi:branched-chain amino acid transport system ATP-binding protein
MTTALECKDVRAGYHGMAVVRELNLTLSAGEVMALLGPNGSGKTTLLNTIAKLLPIISGDISTPGSRSDKKSNQVVLVPDDRALFTTLTTRENLVLALPRKQTDFESVLELFPALTSRLDVTAGNLSGGEQQMLALARAILQRPKVLLIDELSMGLAPALVRRILPVIRQIAREQEVAVLLVEQHMALALEFSDHATVLVHGEVVFSGTSDEALNSRRSIEEAYLGKH